MAIESEFTKQQTDNLGRQLFDSILNPPPPFEVRRLRWKCAKCPIVFFNLRWRGWDARP